MSKPETTVVGIYGAWGEEASGNPALRELVEGQEVKCFLVQLAVVTMKSSLI